MTDPTDEQIAAFARERHARLAWEAVARGQRSADEVARERAEAGDDPEEIERAKQLFRPYDEAQGDALMEALFGPPDTDAESEPAPEPVELDTKRRRTRRRLVIATLLCAAAIAIVVLWPSPDPPVLASLPEYEVELDRRDPLPGSAERGPAADQPESFRPTTHFKWSFVPRTPVEGGVEVRVFFIAAGERVPRLILDAEDSALIEVDERGIVVMSGEISALGLEPGEWEIVVAIAAAGAAGRPTIYAGRTLVSTDALRVERVTIQIEALPLDAWIIGCDQLSTTRCLRKPSSEGPLRLWLEAETPATEALSLAWKGETLAAEARVIPEFGIAWELELPTTGTLSLSHADGRHFELSLDALSPAFIAAYDELEADEGKGASALLASVGELALADDYEAYLLRCAATRWIARSLELPAMRRALAELGDEAEAHGDRGCISRVRAGVIDGMLYEPDQDTSGEIEALRDSRPYLRSKLVAGYFDGIRHLQGGRLELAREALAHSVTLAKVVAARASEAEALAVLAQVYERFGRHRQAAAARSEALAISDISPRLRMEVQAAVAWSEVLRGENDPASADASPRLEDWLSEYAERGELSPRDREWVNSARLDKALADLQHERREAARVELERVDPALLFAHDMIWYSLAQARLATGPKIRRALLEEALRVPTFDPDGPLRVLLDLAELEVEAGASEAALARYRQAEQLELEISRSLWPDSGRGSFLSDRSRARSRQLELLLSLERPEDALCMVLRARARHHSSLVTTEALLESDPEALRAYRQYLHRYEEVRDELEGLREQIDTLVGEERSEAREHLREGLRALDEDVDEVLALIQDVAPAWACERVRSDDPEHGLVTMYPASSGDDWWYLFDRGGEVEVWRSGSDSMWAELGERAAGLELLTVVPVGGHVSQTRSGATLGEEGPLLTRSLGLGRRAGPRFGRPGSAVIVADDESLAGVSSEGEALASELHAAGWAVERAWSVDEEPPSLLHYAGHGYRDDFDGWDSYLGPEPDPARPEQRGRIHATEVLAAQRGPTVVVLGACKAGASEAELVDGGMNMATAFLLAGAQLVIAPRQPVADALAEHFAAALYASPPPPDADADALVEHMLHALRKAQQGNPAFSAWAAWTP